MASRYSGPPISRWETRIAEEMNAKLGILGGSNGKEASNASDAAMVLSNVPLQNENFNQDGPNESSHGQIYRDSPRSSKRNSDAGVPQSLLTRSACTSS